MESHNLFFVDDPMGKLKVLFISYVYPPQKSPRSVQISYLASELSKKTSLSILTMSHEEGLDFSLNELNTCDDVEYASKSFITRFVHNMRGDKIKRNILPDASYVGHFDLQRMAKKIVQKECPDTVITFGQPMSTHLIGLKLKRQFPKIKWFAHFSDPWVDNPYNQYNPWTRFINQRFQNQVFEKADKLLFTSQETIDLVTSTYVKKIYHKTDVLPHCFSEELHKNLRPKTRKFPILIRYIGSFYGDRQPDSLLAAIQKLSPSIRARIRCEFVGSSTTNLQEKIICAGLEKIVFSRPSVSYLASLRIMHESDILLNIDAPAETSPFLPSKLIDYIGANKPIFGITPPGTASKLLNELKCPVASPHDSNEIAIKLEMLISRLLRKEKIFISESSRMKFTKHGIGLKAYSLFEKTK